jgi:hypothetical protein
MAAAVRSGTCSFIRIAETWLRAVLSVMPSCRAISELRAPSASRPSTSRSRGVRSVRLALRKDSARTSAWTALALGVVSVLSVGVFWLALPPVFGVAAVMLARDARDRHPFCGEAAAIKRVPSWPPSAQSQPSRSLP